MSTPEVLLSRRMWVALLMGFVSGLPLALTGSLLQARMTEAGVNLGTIGLFSLVGLPYTLKFLWAPLLDQHSPLPGLGRRRGWLVIWQSGLIFSIAALGMLPAQQVMWIAVLALVVAFCSASQDIIIDAYRRESLTDQEQGLGASMYVNGYRVAMMVSGGGGLWLADHVSYVGVYNLMALLMASAALSAYWCAQEPDEPSGAPRTLQAAVLEPFIEYFARRDAWLILVFILLYKLGDTLAGQLTTPFYLSLGFSKTEVGAIVKLFGFWATLLGGFVGGLLILQIGIYRALWGFGILQACSTAGFIVLAQVGYSPALLTAVISFENLTAGLGTAAFVAFMASLTDRRFTATQYALLSSLMGVPRVLLSAPAGYLVEWLGWVNYFSVCVAIAIPGLLLLLNFRDWLAPDSANSASVSQQADA